MGFIGFLFNIPILFQIGGWFGVYYWIFNLLESNEKKGSVIFYLIPVITGLLTLSISNMLIASIVVMAIGSISQLIEEKVPKYESNKQISLINNNVKLDDNKNINEGIENKDYNLSTLITESPKENNFKKIFKGIGSGLGIGGLVTYGWLSFILHYVFVGIASLLMLRLAISLFSKGSVILGLLVLFIGIPIVIIVIGLISDFLIILAIIALIIWGIFHIFGFSISFGSAFSSAWVGILAITALLIIKEFIEAVRQKRVLEFFKEFWWEILLFCLLLWLFFF